MQSYKSTKIQLEDNARMFVRTGDTEIEINVRPTEVNLEQEKLSKFKTDATEFREEQLNNEKEVCYKRNMVEKQLVENRNLVITNRGTGRSHQTVLYMMDDPTVITLVRDKSQKNNLLDILKKLNQSKEDFINYVSIKHISGRILTFEHWENIGAHGRTHDINLHIDNVEHYLEYKLGRQVNSFTTGHRAVSGFSNEFNKAEEV